MAVANVVVTIKTAGYFNHIQGELEVTKKG
jgi:hypothetical protein